MSKKALGVFLWLLGAPFASAQDTPQPSHYDYQEQPGVAGKLTSVGSDTLANLMTFWSQQFKVYYPQVQFQIQASGSATAPPALAERTASLGPMSRELKASEWNYFVRKHGYPPTVLKVAIDAIAIFVDRSNPLAGLTLQQLDAIYSVTRYCGAPEGITLWKQLGLNKPGYSSITLYGRNSVSGTYGQFKEQALCKGDFRARVKEQPGSASVVQAVGYSKGAMGYAAFGYQTAGVRALPLAENDQVFVPVNEQTITSGQYPLSRYLYLVVDKPPGEALPPPVLEFIRFVLSNQGQQTVKRDGYVAIPPAIIQQQLKLVSEVRQ